MTEPTTPQVSAARREQVARALCALIDLDFDDEDTDCEWCLKDTDAFLSVVLPDVDQFMELLDDLMYSATVYGHAAPNSAHERWAARKTGKARDALIALVYGEQEERE